VNTSRTLTDIDLAELFDVEDRTVRNWVARGAPCSGKGIKRRFDGDEVAAWLKANGLTGAHGRPEEKFDPTDPLKLAKLRKENAMAEYREIQVGEKKGLLIDKAEAERFNVQKFMTVRNKMLGLSASVSPVLVGLSAPDIERVLDERITEILTELSRE
jgi:phage terminase Nu1 subunit (DNA packaging protein)